MYGLVFGLLIVLVIIYVYWIQYSKGDYKKVFLDDLLKSKVLKTGDIILFKAYNNYNSIILGSYFGHVGVCYVDPLDPQKTPYLFESNGIEHMPLKEHHSKNGVFFTPLENRIQKYKGRVFVKTLVTKLDDCIVNDFYKFIQYCLMHMWYNTNVLLSAFKKGLGLEYCGHGTNCGELTFISLIKLSLLPISYYNKNMFHHLNFVTSIKKLNNNEYNDIVEIIDHPFYQ